MEVLREALKTYGPVSYLASACGMGARSFNMMLNYYEPENFFFYATHKGTKKVDELRANKHVTVALYDTNTNNQVIADCTCELLDDNETKAKLWNEQWRQYGYQGPTDEAMLIIKLAVSSVAEHFLGRPTVKHAVAPKPMESFTVGPYVPPETTGTVDEAAGLKLLHECLEKTSSTMLTTRSGPEVHARIMMMLYKENVGFYYLTHVGSQKYKDLLENPFCSVEWFFGGDFANMQMILAPAAATVYTTQAQRDLVWDDSLRQFGFTDHTDPAMAIVRLAFSSVTRVRMGGPSETFVMPKPALVRAQEAMDAAFARNPTVFLATHASEGRIAGRMMLLRRHPAVGIYFLTHAHSPKVQQIKANSNVTFSWIFDKPAYEQISVKAHAYLHTGEAGLRHFVWDDALKQYGYQCVRALNRALTMRA